MVEAGAKNLVGKMRPGDYLLTKVSEVSFLLEHLDGYIHEITVIVVDGKVVF